jgi:hypothetical protein
MLSFQQKDGSFNGPLTQLDILEHTAEISHADEMIYIRGMVKCSSLRTQRIDDFLRFWIREIG